MQDQPHISLLTRLRSRFGFTAEMLVVVSRVLVFEYVLGFGIWYALADGMKDLSGTPLGADFINVYAAGVMIWRGQAALVYDWPTHHMAEQAVLHYPSPYFGWHYPPLFMFVAALVALVPYLWAFAFYMAASFAGYWIVVRRIALRTKESFWALLAFSGVFANIGNGQNGFITTALFGGGLLLLEKNPWLAGALFGILSYKPQFFVVIPLILLVGGYNRALIASVLSAAVCMGISWAVFGTEVWRAFFESTKLTQHVVLERGTTGWEKIQSVFSMVRMYGGGIEAAYMAQGIVAAAALACAGWVWHRKSSFADRVGVLSGAMLLTTPYLMDYDLVLLAVPLAYLARQGMETGFRRYEKLLLSLLWFWPLLARSWGKFYLPLTPFLLAAMIALCMMRTRSEAKR